MSKIEKDDEELKQNSLLLKNPFVIDKTNEKKIVLIEKTPKNRTIINETIQDEYCFLKSINKELSLRSISSIKNREFNEYILYYKIGHIFIRPMGVFSGVMMEEFYEIIPYSFRRSNGELDWLIYTSNKLTLVHDYNFIYGTTNNSAKSVMIMANDNGKVFVFGEMYRGFAFGSPSTLDLKGRLYMGQTNEDGSVNEDSIESNSIIEVNKGSMVVFICDFCNIIIIPDHDCQMTVKESATKKSSSHQRSKNRLSRKKSINKVKKSLIADENKIEMKTISSNDLKNSILIKEKFSHSDEKLLKDRKTSRSKNSSKKRSKTKIRTSKLNMTIETKKLQNPNEITKSNIINKNEKIHSITSQSSYKTIQSENIKIMKQQNNKTK